MKVFEFNTLRFTKLDIRPALVCVLALLAFEFGVARNELIWTVDQRSESGQFDVLEKRVIADAPDPVVVVLGNSRTRDALAPTVLEEAWGLERGGVMNLSMTGGEPFDYRVFLERQGETIGKAQVVVLAVEDWIFRADPLISERFVRFADWADRMKAYEASEDPGLLLGGVWQTYNARVMIRRAPIEWLMRHQRQLKLTDDGRVTWREQDPEVGSETFDMAWELDTYYRGYEPGRATIDDLIEAAEALHRGGVRVVLVRPPMRDAFVDERSKLAPGAQAHFEGVIAELQADRPWLEAVVHERGSELGLGWRAYIDYGHMSREGADAYSRWFAERVRPGPVEEGGAD